MTIYTGIKRFGGTGHQPVFRDGLPLPLEPSQSLLKVSPDGFNWGYSGDGPKQLALALLLDVTLEPVTALKYYHPFTKEFVARWSEAWSLSHKEVTDWLGLKQAEERGYIKGLAHGLAKGLALGYRLGQIDGAKRRYAIDAEIKRILSQSENQRQCQ